MKHSTRNPRLVAGLAIAAAVTLTLTACGGDTAEPGGSASGGGEELAVTLITKTATNPFFIAMQQGAEEAGKANNVTITTAAGKEDGDEATQIQAIEAAMARGDDGILITPATDGVNPAIQQARDAGLYVIALDTPPNPPDVADITFATDNFKAGELIGQWAAASLDGKKANIAMLDLFNDKIASVDYNRDQGFLTGMGIDVKDKEKNGDEDKTGSYTGGKGGEYQIFCNEPTNGAQDKGRTAMETCLNQSKDINVVYTINEPAAVGASEALDAAGLEDVTIVSVDGGCSPGLEAVKSGVIAATSQQYPVKMAQLGVEAIAKFKATGEKPAVTPGLGFFDTGVALVTDKPMDGVESIDVAAGEAVCWGK
ncbi:fructose transport system substrate-binding protein [Friedmanniella luteola]|uniref:Fructose transport system substrate-binding protein n=1 Tax=Friedmanniella luteola TaxID=546871 RepID=A0A1H1VNV3_9ACTN|nr:substrate-binding domain-containing protein [Friedmanniella luteola]SDS86375.1 fructose transport system substrate-binding protein [Friedmanniella luteola]